MKRIYFLLSILLLVLTASAQTAWIFNRGDSLSWQPIQDMTVTFEKDPSGFFWQNIKNGIYDLIKMPVLNGDGITTWNYPYVQAEKDHYVLLNSDNNYFDVVIKRGNNFFNYKIVGKDSDKFWYEKGLYRMADGAQVLTFGYEPNNSDSKFEAQIVFEAEPLFEEPPFDENIDKRGLKDTIYVVVLSESISDDMVNALKIQRKDNTQLFLPIEEPINIKFVDNDENLLFSGKGIEDLKLNILDIEEFRVAKTLKGNISKDMSGISDNSGVSSDTTPRIYVDAKLRINVISEWLAFGAYAVEKGWTSLSSSQLKNLMIEAVEEDYRYTFDYETIGLNYNVVCNGNEIRKFGLEIQKYYDVPQSERDALMDFYKATGGDNWYQKNGWGSDLPVNKWYGVGGTWNPEADKVTQIHVAGLSLPNNNLTGNLPESISNLKHLGYLMVNNNNLTGTLPSGLANLLINELDVSDNSLSGDFSEHPLSEIMDNIDYSWFLYFGGNEFSSTIPEWAQNHPKFKEHWPNFIYQKGNDASVFNNVSIPAPDINLIDLEGNRHSSPEEYNNNKLTIFYYWATWCPFSPELNKKLIPAYKQYKDAGLNIIGFVDLDEHNQIHDTRELVEDYCKEHGITWPNVPLEQDLEGNFSWDNVITPWRFWIGGVPTVFAVNGKGEVVFQSLFYNGYSDLIPVIEDMFGPIDSEHGYEYYTSTDYSHDGEVITLQSANRDHAIDLVFMGDGFTDKDMDSGGLYEQKMNEAMNQFFKEEPYNSLRDRFNVYAVKAVSPNGIFASDAKHAIDRDNAKAFKYAQKALGENADRMMVGVVYNTNYAVDRSYTTLYEKDGSFVAYMMGGVSKVLNHEMGGHGIALLLDEYVEPGMENVSPDDEAKATFDAVYDSYGEGANIDWRSDPTEVKWAHLLNDSRYASEGLGVYEGAYYGRGMYRPTLNSMMRHNDCGFNAPSREAIYKRVMKLSEGDSWTYDYETFVTFDTPAREAYKQTRTKARVKDNTLLRRVESRPPTIIKGTWRDAFK